MNHSRPFVLLSLLTLTACANDDAGEDTTPPICDGIKQADEVTVDAPFDADGDGHMDASNFDCGLTYPRAVLDCDDADPDVSPSATEVLCNEKDDDCNSATADALDADRDGVPVCRDCDDQDPTRNEDNAEVCWDNIDNNCNDVADEDCGLNYNGLFEVEVPPTFQCGNIPLSGPLHEIKFTSMSVQYDGSGIIIRNVQGSEPGPMIGTVDSLTGAFSVSLVNQVPGDCSSQYSLIGSFTGTDHFEGTFTASYSGTPQLVCFGCVGTTFEISADRMITP